MGTWNYFKDEEIVGLDNELVAKLDQARHLAGIPFIITSGFREGDPNGIDHGIKNSAHMNHKAVDLRCRDSATRFKIMFGLISAGFKRIGINNVHIHADCDETKPQEVFWMEPDDPGVAVS